MQTETSESNDYNSDPKPIYIDQDSDPKSIDDDKDNDTDNTTPTKEK